MWEIQGERPNGQWISLYCYRDGRRARAVLAHILALEEYPRELEDFEDFRLRSPDDSPPLDQPSDEAPEGQDTAPEAPVSPRKGRKRGHKPRARK